MSDATKQHDNVGNLGDVIKHTSLVAILEALRSREGPLLYAETNAFRHSAPLKKSWEVEKACLIRGAAFRSYQEIESSYYLEGQYLCSPGIAERLLGIGEGSRVEFILCEKDSECLELLREAIPAASFLTDHKDLAAELKNRTERYRTAIALVDPYQFRHVRALFPQWLEALSKSTRPSGLTVALVFDYSQHAPKWPRYPSGAMNQVGAFRQDQYCLALYANQPGVQAVQATLEDTGWTFNQAQ